MPKPSGLTSNDAALEESVSGWLGESRMPLPAGLRLSLDFVESLPMLDDPRNVYHQDPVEIQAGEPQGWAHVSWPGFAVARIEEFRPGARVLLTREAVASFERFARGFLLVVLIFLWKRDRRFHVHAGAAKDPENRGWMLAGNPESGKSTTMALLATRGWDISTDDFSFLMDCGKRVGLVGFREPIALRPDGWQRLGRNPPESGGQGNKGGVWPEELGGGWAQIVEPDIVLFSQAIGDHTVLTPAEPGEILGNLIQSSAWVMREATGATEHLELMARLGRQARCYNAVLGPDLFARPEALAGFLP